MRFFLTSVGFWLFGLLHFLVMWPQAVLAADLNDPHSELTEKLNNFKTAAGYADKTANAYSTAGLAGTLGGIVKVVLAFLGVIFLIIVIVSGFKWMTTNNPEEIKKVKTKLINATIGLVIILASYAITYFVLTQLIPEDLVTSDLQTRDAGDDL